MAARKIMSVPDAKAARLPILAKREKNRDGHSSYHLSVVQQKVEDACNKELRRLNRIVSGETPQPEDKKEEGDPLE